MDFLQDVFDMWLVMLTNFIADNYMSGILWMFILIMVALLLFKIWKGVFSWKL